MSKGDEVSPYVRGEVLNMLAGFYSPENPLSVPRSVYDAAMQDPELAQYADRMKVAEPIPVCRRLYQSAVAPAVEAALA